MSLNISVHKIKVSPLIMAGVPSSQPVFWAVAIPQQSQVFPGPIFLLHPLCQLLQTGQRRMHCTGIAGILPPSAPHFCTSLQLVFQGSFAGPRSLSNPHGLFTARSLPPLLNLLPRHKQGQTLLQLPEFVNKPSTVPTAPWAHSQGTVGCFPAAPPLKNPD